jgi:hypothetical protein
LDAFSHAQGQNILHGNRTHTFKFVISRLPVQLKFRSSNCKRSLGKRKMLRGGFKIPRGGTLEERPRKRRCLTRLGRWKMED